MVRVIDVEASTGGKVLRVLLNADADRVYTIVSDSGNLFGSPPLEYGDHWEQDMRNLRENGDLGYRAVFDGGALAGQVTTIWGSRG